MKKFCVTFFTYILVIVIGLKITSICFATSESNNASDTNAKIENINKKIEDLTSKEMQSIKDSAQGTINTANLVITMVSVVFVIVAYFGYLFRTDINNIESRARESAKNMKGQVKKMESIVRRGEEIEKEMNKRKADFDIYIAEKTKVFDDLKKVKSRLNSKRTNLEQRAKIIAELEEKIDNLQKKSFQYSQYPSFSPSASPSISGNYYDPLAYGTSSAVPPYYPTGGGASGLTGPVGPDTGPDNSNSGPLSTHYRR